MRRTSMLEVSRKRSRAIFIAAGVAVVAAAAGVGIAATRDTRDSGAERISTTHTPAPALLIEVQGHWRLTSATIDGDDIVDMSADSFASFHVDDWMEGPANTGCPGRDDSRRP